MDVTALLNTATAGAMERRNSVDQMAAPSTAGSSTASSSMVSTPSPRTSPPRRSHEYQLPSRSRTPWDAGGYSLPLAIDTKSIRSPPVVQTALCCESSSPTDIRLAEPFSPKCPSPRHKFSDSRSSLSSLYTASSSANSVSHSRFSSLSTVSEYQPLAALITDFSSLATRAPDDSAPSDYFDKRDDDLPPQSPTPIRARHRPSPESSAEPSPRSSVRPQSPSDAVLITRSQAHDPAGHSTLNSASSHLILHSFSSLQPDSPPTRGHKRAVSAPDFPSLTARRTFNRRFPTFGPIPEPTPPSSHHSDQMSGDGMDPATPRSSTPTGTPSSSDLDVESAAVGSNSPAELPARANPPSAATTATVTQSPPQSSAMEPTTDEDGNPKCLAVDEETELCKMNSVNRKVISHYFGRNKLCTRMIPDDVWVHYCRKHYQRHRYRDTIGWAKEQCGLVVLQIDRVMNWSNSNLRAGLSGIVRDWSLSVRKREQRRLDANSGKGKKRARVESDDDEPPEDPNERAEIQGTAVPPWLLNELGEGYSAEHIKEIVRRLEADLNEGRLLQIPDIEILPNIATDGAPEGHNKKGAAKKKPGAHKRSKSMGLATHDSSPLVRRGSQPGHWTPHLHFEKRQRRMDSERRMEAELAREEEMEMQEAMEQSRRAAFMGHMTLPTRPRESPPNHGYYTQRQAPETQPQYSMNHQQQLVPQQVAPQHVAPHHAMPSTAAPPWGNNAAPASVYGHGPLPAPMPQRVGPPGMAQQLESNAAHVASRRPNMHQRSQSEAGFLHPSQGPSSYNRPTSSSGLSAFPPPAHSQSHAHSQSQAQQMQHGYPGPSFQPHVPTMAPHGSGYHGNGYSHYEPSRFVDYGSASSGHYQSNPHGLYSQGMAPSRPRPAQYDARGPSMGARAAEFGSPATVDGDGMATRHSRHRSSPTLTRLPQLGQAVQSSVASAGRVATPAAAHVVATYGDDHNSSRYASFHSTGRPSYTPSPAYYPAPATQYRDDMPPRRRASHAEIRPLATTAEDVVESGEDKPATAHRHVKETDKTKEIYSSRR